MFNSASLKSMAERCWACKGTGIVHGHDGDKSWSAFCNICTYAQRKRWALEDARKVPIETVAVLGEE